MSKQRTKSPSTHRAAKPTGTPTRTPTHIPASTRTPKPKNPGKLPANPKSAVVAPRGAIRHAANRAATKPTNATTGQRGRAVGKPAKAPGDPKRLSALDAAAKILAESKEPMRCGDLVARMESKGLWKSKSGKTPAATVYAAMIREIAAKKAASRFTRTERGLFAARLK